MALLKEVALTLLWERTFPYFEATVTDLGHWLEQLEDGRPAGLALLAILDTTRKQLTDKKGKRMGELQGERKRKMGRTLSQSIHKCW